MGRRTIPFTEAAGARAVKAVRRGGITEIASVRFEPDGTIVVVPGSPSAVQPSQEANPWDAT